MVSTSTEMSHVSSSYSTSITNPSPAVTVLATAGSWMVKNASLRPGRSRVASASRTLFSTAHFPPPLSP
ncbi:hypothetical protein E2562_019217 [Oryza meyeriana var. granulata]|uniref:Uncharacterized protein n=1 Tax=Oryza meyeriana var. granulata TaxID=110450 RepID=A0A6G1FAA0_9ORYZ|nr:hypothetical protein E2562_019217 [Oryza meyeriana var. granulata]